MRPPLLTSFALAFATAVGTSASAQITMDPNGVIDGFADGKGWGAAVALLDHVTSRLGQPTAGQNHSTGPATDYDGPCPPVETILDDDAHPVGIELDVTADGPAGTSRVAIDIEYCKIVSTNPCQVRCFVLRLRWIDLPYDWIYDTFIETPPQGGGTSGGTGGTSGGTGGTSGGTGGWATQFIEDEEGCHVIQVVVTPWGAVMTGEKFAANHPGHVAAFLASLEQRLYPMTFDPECVTFSKP